MRSGQVAESAQAELLRGQGFEAQGTPESLAQAVHAYERAAALLTPPPPDVDARRLLGVVWMNRGNALQKSGDRAGAVDAYDEAIALFRGLPFTQHPALRNHLGAAWLNRGHALRHTTEVDDIREALRSLREAIEILGELPLDQTPSFRLNYAGAWANLADVLAVSDEPDRFAAARQAARQALQLTEPGEQDSAALARLGLMARRAQLVAVGQLLVTEPSRALTTEASDVLDAGLALARRWSAELGLREFATRLLYFGAEFYRRHLPQFLAEFLLENVDAAHGAPRDWAQAPEMRSIAIDALLRADADLRAPRLWIAGDAETDRQLATRDSLAHARALLGDPVRPL